MDTMEQLLVEDDKYKVVDFNLEYTNGRAVDTTNNLKVLKTLDMSCQKLVNIQGQYRVWSGEKKKQNDSLVDLAAAIIDPYNRDMKAECDKDKYVWHKA
ncbi:hypothetical protein D1007_01541 [Hordeum vulgare]|nr:hypothetical protein D1007_01541 [Hordeum vulgare]